MRVHALASLLFLAAACGKAAPPVDATAPTPPPDRVEAPTPPAPMPMRTTGAVLATVPPGEHVDDNLLDRYFRPDGGAVAFTTGDGTRLYRDGVAVEGFDHYDAIAWTVTGELAFRGTRHAPRDAAGRSTSSVETWLVVGSTRYGPYGRIVRTYLDDYGGSWLIATRPARQGGTVLVHDGVAGPVFSAVRSPDIVAGSDHGIAAFRAKAPGGGGGACAVWRDGSACFPGVGRPVVSADGRVVAFSAHTAGDAAHAVIDGRAGPTFEDVWWQIQLSEDGRTSAYVATRDGRQLVVHGDREGSAYDRVMDLRMSADGAVVAYKARRGTRWLVVHGEREQPAEGELDDVQLTRDGRHAAWVDLVEGRRGLRSPAQVVIDGERHPREPCVRSLLLAEDGHVGYVACAPEGQVMVLDGTRGEVHAEVGSLQRDPVGGWGYVARDRDGFRVITGHGTFGPYPAITDGGRIVGDAERNFVYAPHGGTVVFRAQREDGWHLVVDGVEGPAVDAIYPPVSFSEDGRTVGYGARVGRELRWMTAPVGAE